MCADYWATCRISGKRLEILKENISALRIADEKYTIINTEADRFFLGDHKYVDIYLLDPPFKMANLQKTIDFLIQSDSFLKDNLIVVEHELNQKIKSETEHYIIFKEKKFGRSLISFIQRK